MIKLRHCKASSLRLVRVARLGVNHEPGLTAESDVYIPKYWGDIKTEDVHLGYITDQVMNRFGTEYWPKSYERGACHHVYNPVENLQFYGSLFDNSSVPQIATNYPNVICGHLKSIQADFAAEDGSFRHRWDYYHDSMYRWRLGSTMTRIVDMGNFSLTNIPVTPSKKQGQSVKTFLVVRAWQDFYGDRFNKNPKGPFDGTEWYRAELWFSLHGKFSVYYGFDSDQFSSLIPEWYLTDTWNPMVPSERDVVDFTGRFENFISRAKASARQHLINLGWWRETVNFDNWINQITILWQPDIIHWVVEDNDDIEKISSTIQWKSLLDGRKRPDWNDLASRAYGNVARWSGNGLAYIKDAIELTTTVKSFIETIRSVPSKKVKALCASWLAIHYGFKLTVLDTLEIWKILNQDPNFGLGRASATENIERDFSVPGLVIDTVARYQVHFDCAKALYDTLGSFLRTIDFQLDLGNIWDLIPFSFVVDWFVSVGDLFEALDGYYGLYHHYETMATSESMKSRFKISDFERLGLTAQCAYLDCSFYQRVYLDRPLVPLPSWNIQVPSLIHWIEGATLIVANR